MDLNINVENSYYMSCWEKTQFSTNHLFIPVPNWFFLIKLDSYHTFFTFCQLNTQLFQYLFISNVLIILHYRRWQPQLYSNFVCIDNYYYIFIINIKCNVYRHWMKKNYFSLVQLCFISGVLELVSNHFFLFTSQCLKYYPFISLLNVIYIYIHTRIYWLGLLRVICFLQNRSLCFHYSCENMTFLCYEDKDMYAPRARRMKNQWLCDLVSYDRLFYIKNLILFLGTKSWLRCFCTII